MFFYKVFADAKFIGNNFFNILFSRKTFTDELFVEKSVSIIFLWEDLFDELFIYRWFSGPKATHFNTKLGMKET